MMQLQSQGSIFIGRMRKRGLQKLRDQIFGAFHHADETGTVCIGVFDSLYVLLDTEVAPFRLKNIGEIDKLNQFLKRNGERASDMSSLSRHDVTDLNIINRVKTYNRY